MFKILLLMYYVYYLGQSVSKSLVNQSNGFEDVALNVDTNKTQNLDFLLDAADFAKFLAMKDLRGYCTPGSYFWRLCAFPQKIEKLRTKNPMDLVRNVPRNSKITVLLQWRPLLWSYSEKCVKINIFHVLRHKSITTWVSEIPVQ